MFTEHCDLKTRLAGSASRYDKQYDSGEDRDHSAGRAGGCRTARRWPRAARPRYPRTSPRHSPGAAPKRKWPTSSPRSTPSQVSRRRRTGHGLVAYLVLNRDRPDPRYGGADRDRGRQSSNGSADRAGDGRSRRVGGPGGSRRPGMARRRPAGEDREAAAAPGDVDCCPRCQACPSRWRQMRLRRFNRRGGRERGSLRERPGTSRHHQRPRRYCRDRPSADARAGLGAAGFG